MPARPLGPEEKALWRRVTRDVRPLAAPVTIVPEPEPAPKAKAPAVGVAASAPAKAGARAAQVSPGTLDGTWDRKLRRGLSLPEVTIDLHGHSLASAHRTLAAALDRAVANDIRLMLLITGKPPRGGGPRGAIRAAIGDWLGGSPHASQIAALRNAHPRHGGEGALYLVLRRTMAKERARIP